MKKYYLFYLIPIYGMPLVIVCLFIEAVFDNIRFRTVCKCMRLCGLVSIIPWFINILIIAIFVKFVNPELSRNVIIFSYIISSGYIMNLFSFLVVRKKAVFEKKTNDK